jgi:hypothetical protein
MRRLTSRSRPGARPLDLTSSLSLLAALCTSQQKSIMASKKKSTAVSASSFLELRAEIARHEEDFGRSKGSGKKPSKVEKQVLVQSPFFMPSSPSD